MQKLLDKNKLGEWMARLEGHNVYAPRREDGIWHYQLLDGEKGGIGDDYTNCVHSPKKIVFPQREVFFEFEQKPGKAPELHETIPDPTPNVVFGVRPCDGVAIGHMDKVFSGELEDKYYWARRNVTTYVGLACNAPHAASCFCTAVGGSPGGEDGLDILMTDLGDAYFLKALTDKGREILQKADGLTREAGKDDEKKAQALHEKAGDNMLRSVKGLNQAAEKLKAIFESDFWDNESRACISCGICTFLCPTCHCFDINDEVHSSTPLKGERVRTWDTCQYPDFTLHSSSHNPRDEKAARMRQRINHKFLYFVENYDSFMCTGCGRCISECPVSIDIASVMNKVAEYDL